MTDSGVSTEILFFTAPWCESCKTAKRVMEHMGLELKAKAVTATIDVDEHPELGTRYGVRNLPTLIVRRGGKELARLTAAGITRNAILRAIV